jgi:hypothetical protein
MNSKIQVQATSAFAAISLLIPDQERASTGVAEISISNSLQTSFRQAEPRSIESGDVKAAASTQVLVPAPKKKWAMNQMPRFMSLLEKHSLLKATAEEEAELEQLQKLKGHADDRRTADELLLEWKFRQRVDQILKLLQETGIHGPEQTHPPDSPWFSA